VGLIYRRDKALSKAALGFIKVTIENAGTERLLTPNQRVRTAGS
jgi:hypothetical protein